MTANPQKGSFENNSNSSPVFHQESCAAQKKSRIVKIICIAFLTVVVFIPVILLAAFGLLFCADTYNDTAECGNFTFAYGYYMGIHKMLGQNHAAVTEYLFDGEDSSREIFIPDSFNNIEIRELGGYMGRGVPMTFRIKYSPNSLDNDLIAESVNHYMLHFTNIDEIRAEVDEVIYDDFVLYLGKKIESIHVNKTVSVYELQYERTIARCVRFSVVCDKDNPNFYSENGILYNKDGTVFDYFTYVGQELNTSNE